MNREQKSGYSIILACWGGFDFLFIIVNLLVFNRLREKQRHSNTYTLWQSGLNNYGNVSCYAEAPILAFNQTDIPNFFPSNQFLSLNYLVGFFLWFAFLFILLLTQAGIIICRVCHVHLHQHTMVFCLMPCIIVICQNIAFHSLHSSDI